jgi:YD repeat-containing protein
MRSVRSLLGSLTLLLTLVIFCGVPAFPQDLPGVAMGMNPQATYHSGDFDFIDMVTGRLSLHIPLVVDQSQRGRLNFTSTVTYTSTGTWISVSNPNPRGAPLNEPPKYGVSAPWFSADGWLSSLYQQPYQDPITRQWSYSFSIFENGFGFGLAHPMGTLSGNGANGTLESIDGSGIRDSIISNVDSSTDKEGLQFHISSGYVEDANGNKMTSSGSSTTSTMTDTLGRAWTTTYNSSDVSGCPTGGPVAPTSSTIWTIPGPANVSNGVRKFKFCYSPYVIGTHFNNGGVEYTANVNSMTGVVLPNLTTWRFDYDNNSYGDLIAVHTPTGGSISYTWTFSGGACSGSEVGIGTRTVATRTVSDGINSHTWTYTWTNGSLPTYTATDPLGNDTVYASPSCSGLVTQIQYYAGTGTSRTLLKTVAKAYRSLPDPYPTDLAQRQVPNPALLASTTTMWPNGQQSQVQLTYDSGFTFTNTNPGNHANPYTSSYGLLTAETHQDYGNGAPGPVLSTTNTNYLALSNSTYATANILDLPSFVITTAGNGNKCAETDYGYDTSAQIVSSGITEQHVSAPSSVRGDLTSITRQLYARCFRMRSTAIGCSQLRSPRKESAPRPL